MRRLLLLLSVLAVCGSACSDSDSTRSSTTSAVSSSSLRSKLLTIDDLPDGFRQVRADERDPSAPVTDTAEGQFCTEIDQHRKGFPGERVAEADFERARGTAIMYVNEEVTQYTNAGVATQAFAAFSQALGQCASVTKKDGGNALFGSFDPVEFPEIGDELLAKTFNATQTVDEDSASISGYFVAMRVDRYLILFSALGAVDSLGKGDVEEIANRVVARL